MITSIDELSLGDVLVEKDNTREYYVKSINRVFKSGERPHSFVFLEEWRWVEGCYFRQGTERYWEWQLKYFKKKGQDEK